MFDRYNQFPIIVLPDEVLIEMFHFYSDSFVRSRSSAGWRRLVRVCRGWRNLVFGSPLHLGVKLQCKAKTSLREMLDVCPALPISMRESVYSNLSQVEHEPVLAILMPHQRVSETDLTGVPNGLLEQVGKTMQKSFPALTKLLLESNSPSPQESLIKDSLLNGSAPRLRELEFKNIPLPYPALSNILLSTSDLRYLELYSIPPAFIPSKVMAACLSGLTRLEVLVIEFCSSRFRRNQNSSSPPPTRTALPVLTHLRFQGRCDYLEDLVASIDAPVLSSMSLSFFKGDARHSAYLQIY